MFEISKFETDAERVRMEISYTLPIDGAVVKKEKLFCEKAMAMRYFSSCAATMLMVRFEEFKNILSSEVFPHYTDTTKIPFLGYQGKWLATYWKLFDLYKDLSKMFEHPYGQAVEVLRNFHLIEHCIPAHHSLQHQKLSLIALDIRTTAKNLKETIDKLSKILNDEIQTENYSGCKN